MVTKKYDNYLLFFWEIVLCNIFRFLGHDIIGWCLLEKVFLFIAVFDYRYVIFHMVIRLKSAWSV